MKLIVGLGNPDKEYLNTYHNLGFMAVDEACKQLNVEFNKTKCKAKIAEVNIAGSKVIFAKPLTYMNNSGESVRELLSFYKIPLSNLLVIYDDFDIPKGTLRLRENGSAGTHNGMKNILLNLGSGDFCRIRIGFKSEAQDKIPLLNLVLSGIRAEDKPIFDKAINVCASAICDFASDKPFQTIMKKYNGSVNA